jgi:hypothetical protein
VRAAECEFCDEVYERDYLAEALDSYALDLAHEEALHAETERARVRAEEHCASNLGIALGVRVEADRLREALSRLVAAGRNVSGPVLAYHANPTIETLLAKGRAMVEYTAALAHAEKVSREQS